MSDVQRLRDEVKKARQRAGAKISRNRQKGIEIGGTEADPRRNPALHKRYNAVQLRTYLRELNEFNSRNMQFVAGARGAPLERTAWARYKHAESRYNAVGAEHDAQVADIFIPTSGMTIRERQSTIHPTAQGEFANRPYSQVQLRPSQVPNGGALDKLIKEMQRRNSRNYLPGELKKSREQMKDMLNAIGHTEFVERADGLSENQLDIMWNYTATARLVSLVYEMMKLRSSDSGGKERWHDRVVEDSENELRELFDFAESQPRETGKR